MSTYFYVYPFGVNAAMGELESVSTISDGNYISYSQGWPINYEQDLLSVSTAEPISRQQTNQMFYDITNNINQYQIQGVPYWIMPSQNIPSPTPYPYTQYARVIYDLGLGAGPQIWENQVLNPGVNIVTPGSDNSWLLISGNQQGVKPGTIIDFAGASAPYGYLVCDGSQQIIASYPALYAVLGSIWNQGRTPISGQFYLPQLQSYATAGAGASLPGVGNSVGQQGGSPTSALSNNDQLPLHNHTALTGSFLVNNTTTSPAGHLTPGSSTVGLSGTTSSIGSATPQPFAIVQPTALVLKCIKY